MGGDAPGGGSLAESGPPTPLQERRKSPAEQARPIWKTSDFVVVSLHPTTSPSLPHGAGHRSGGVGRAAPPFLALLPMFFLCFLYVLENTLGNRPEHSQGSTPSGRLFQKQGQMLM